MRNLLVFSAAALLLAACSADSEKTNGQPQEEVPPVQSKKTERQPTKDLVFSVEGQDETITADLAEGQDLLYSLYVDKERYIFEADDEKDVLRSIAEPPEGYPQVQLEFEHVKNENPAEMMETVSGQYDFPLQEKTDNLPFQALALHGASGAESDSEVVTIYLLGVEDGTLLITESYFLEAQEGHGARFFKMLETLETH